MHRAKDGIKYKTGGNWVIIDKNIIKMVSLSITARLVHCFLQGWDSNLPLANNTLATYIGVSERTIGRATEELKKANLYFVQRIGSKTYKGYLGNTRKNAIKYFDECNTGKLS